VLRAPHLRQAIKTEGLAPLAAPLVRLSASVFAGHDGSLRVWGAADGRLASVVRLEGEAPASVARFAAGDTIVVSAGTLEGQRFLQLAPLTTSSSEGEEGMPAMDGARVAFGSSL
jgi:hypothetical protein